MGEEAAVSRGTREPPLPAVRETEEAIINSRIAGLLRSGCEVSTLLFYFFPQEELLYNLGVWTGQSTMFFLGRKWGIRG